MRNLFAAILLLLLLPPVSAAAFDLSSETAVVLEHLGSEEGLSHPSVSGIVQDRDGFLWFATQNGLNRYDGREFRVYTREPFNRNSLIQHLIQTLYYDREEHILWIGTYGGMSRFDPVRKTFTNFPPKDRNRNGLSNEVVVTIEKDDDGRIWAGTLQGLNRLNSSQSTPEEPIDFYRSDPRDPLSLPSDIIRDILCDSRGNLWIATNGGLSLYNPVQESFTNYTPANSPLPSPYVMTILEQEPGILILGTWGGGLVRFHTEDGRMEELPYRQEGSNKNIYTIKRDAQGSLWVGTWGGGVVIMDLQSGEYRILKKSASSDTGLSHNIVYSFAEDRTGIIWIGTNGGGINKFNPRKINFGLYRHEPENPQSLPDSRITAITQDRSGNLWVGTKNEGLCLRRPGSGVFHRFQREPGESSTLSDNSVNTILETSAGELLIGTNRGLNLYDAAAGGFHQDLAALSPALEETLSDEMIVYSLLEDSSGRLWIGSYNHGVYMTEPETGSVAHFSFNPEDPNSLSNNLIFSMTETADGKIWIATNRGLNRWLSGTSHFKHYYHNPDDPDSIPSNALRTLFVSSRETLWIGTEGGGVCFYDKLIDGFKSFSRRDGLTSTKVLSILEDQSGKLWLGTDYGIAVFSPGRNTIRMINRTDGFLSQTYGFGAFQTDKGDLLFGATGQIDRFRNSELKTNRKAPPVQVTEITTFNKPLALSRASHTIDRIRLKWRENFFAFEFAALDYSAPENNQYAYKLEGFDKEWIQAGNRNYASYTNLKGGDYTFRVKAANSDDVWNEEGARIDVTVQPPPWKHPAALTGYLLLALILFWLLVRIRSARRLKGQIEELKQTQARLAAANRDLQNTGRHDPVTGLPEGIIMQEHIEITAALCARASLPLTLLLADIDFFSIYNRHHGWEAGNSCLKTVGQLLLKSCPNRPPLVYRCGSDLFGLLLPGYGREYAEEIIGEVQGKLKTEARRLSATAAVPFLTLSFGIAQADPEAEGEALTELAERALAAAKKERNKQS